jgi:hypothetical protein
MFNKNMLRAGGMVQTTEHLPRKHKALSSNPSTDKTKTTNQTKNTWVKGCRMDLLK